MPTLIPSPLVVFVLLFGYLGTSAAQTSHISYSDDGESISSDPSLFPSFHPTSTPSIDPSQRSTYFPSTQPSPSPSDSPTTTPSRLISTSPSSKVTSENQFIIPNGLMRSPTLGDMVHADECPDQFADKEDSMFRHITIDSYDELRLAIETASEADKICFSDFNVLVDRNADPIVVNKRVHIVCENYSCGIQGGGESAIFHIEGNASVIVQGFTFLGVQRAMWFDGASAKGHLCYCNFLRNNSTDKASTVEISRSSVFIGHSKFIENANSNGVGGAISNSGTLHAYRSTFERNSAAQAGGAIMSRTNATLGLSSCTFVANDATIGSAVYVEGGYDYAVTVNDGNHGANQTCNGIYFQRLGCSEWASPTITNSSILLAVESPNSTSAVPPCDESPEQREIGIMAILVNVSGPALFVDPSSAQSRASEWIMKDDEKSLCPQDPGLIQRYVMAVLYFTLGGDTTWKTCGRTSDNCTSNLHGSPLTWHLSNDSECEWAGLRCNADNCITEIHLDSNNLAGELSQAAVELAKLPCLEVLDLDDNSIFGTLPSSLGTLLRLRVIDIDNNRLHGTLPPTLFELPQLEVLDINNNYFSGGLSSDIAKLSQSLHFLQINGNAFDGEIPSELGQFSHLETITLQDNAFSGKMPDEVCSLRQQGALTSLWADCASPIGGVSCPLGCCTKCM